MSLNMQAKDKDKKNFKRLSKRILSLSGIRRGKRIVDYGENAFLKELEEKIQLKSPINENGKDFANLLNVDLEATVSLDTLTSHENVVKPEAEAKSALQQSPSQSSESIVGRHTVPNPLSPGLQAPRLELGDFMNTSRDSGIDCSVLMSEKNSPEQFVAFTRREAERIRQEQLQYMNGSILETLNETERSSSDDGESEHIMQEPEGDQELDSTVVCRNTTAETCDNLECDNDKTATEQSLIVLTSEPIEQDENNEKEESANSNETPDNHVNVVENDSDRTLLNLSCDSESFSGEGQKVVKSGEKALQTNHVGNATSIISPTTLLVTPITQHSGLSESSSMENYLLNSNENKTDERKSAEARLQQETHDIDCPHLIVSPLPVRSPVVANHKTIPQTPSPASLYINENSAFAKCKSIKRSVSDVGKGILGKLRQKKKDTTSAKSKDDNYTAEEKYETKKFIAGRLKKVTKKKQSQKKEDRTMNDSVLIVDLESTDRQGGYCSDTLAYSREKSPVTKETFGNNPNPVDIGGNFDPSARKKSPVVKEVLQDFDKNRLSHSLLSTSTINTETIEDFTNSITEMTSRLCTSGRSSVESIECICGCQNKMSEQNCCDRRKTPSPQELFEQTDSLMGKCIEITGWSSKSCDRTGKIQTNNDVSTRRQVRNVGNTEIVSESNNIAERKVISEKDFQDLYDSDESDSDEDGSDVSSSDSSQGSIKRFERSSVSSGSSADSDVDSKRKEKCRNKSAVSRDTEDYSSSTDSSSSSSTPVKSNASLNNSTLRTDSCIDDIVFRELDSSPKHVNFNHSHINQSYNPSKYTDFNQFEISLNHFSGSPSSIGYTDLEDSPSAYKEFDHMNGDVMYIGNDSDFFQESFMTNKLDSSLSSPYYKLPSETPASSPKSPCSSLDRTPVPMNISQTQSVSSPSTGCRRKDKYRDYSHINHSVICDSPMSGHSHRQQENPVSQYSSSHDFPNLRRSQSQRGRTFKTQKQTFRSGTNVSFSNMNRSSSSLYSPNKSLSQSGHSSLSTGRLNSSTNRSFSGLNISVGSGHNDRFSTLNDSRRCSGISDRQRKLNSSMDFANQSYMDLNISCSQPNSSCLRQNRSFSTLNDSQYGLNSSVRSINTSFSRLNQSGGINSSYTQSVMSTPPLDLSMAKLKKDQNRESKWVGQMFSPADRVRYKNRGVSESDLCQQILDLYVSDADESGFDVSVNTSQLEVTSSEKSEQSSSPSSPVLQYGKYVAPRNVVKETNVDDFTTTTVRKCYTGEARTRKIQGDESQTSMLREDDGHNTTVEEANLSSQGSVVGQEEEDVVEEGDQSVVEDQAGNHSVSELTDTHDDDVTEEANALEVMNGSITGTGRFGPVKKGRGLQRRMALKDRTNVPLSSLELPSSLASGIDPDSLLQEAQEERTALLMCEKSFDRLTQLYTVHNGQRKVRCLTLNESQNVIKHYPPPKEASRVSWGQTLSELELYRHSPRKTPVKTRPILTQNENNFPYDEDTPSPIVLTKMRKPKTLAKRYKNWPWY